MQFKTTAFCSLILLAFFSWPVAAAAINWDKIQPYLFHAVLAFAVAGLLLAQFSLRRMRKYHKALAKSEERLRLSMWGSGDELWDWNIETGELYRSSAWLEPVETQHAEHADQGDDQHEPETDRCGDLEQTSAEGTAMKPAPFDLMIPSSIGDACRLLAEASGGGARCWRVAKR